MKFLLLILTTVISYNTALPNKYVVIREDATFYQAWRGCQYYGLRLASVRSEEDSQKLSQLLSQTESCTNETFWMAGTDVGMEGRWNWITTNEPLTGFSNWYGINPDNNNVQDCMTVGHFRDAPAMWDDDHCDQVYKYICERIPKKPKECGL